MTRASPARRERRLERKNLRRPKGSHVPLARDPQRHTYATWLAFSELGLGPYLAGKLAIVLIEEETPIRAEDVDGLLVVVSAAWEGPKDEKLDDYVHDTVRKARLVVGRATDPERAWLARSAGAIKGIVNSIAASDIHGAHLALAVLDGNDWRGVVEQVRKRIDGALLGNMPPYQWPLKAAARRLLEAARKNRTENKSAISALRAE